MLRRSSLHAELTFPETFADPRKFLLPLMAAALGVMVPLTTALAISGLSRLSLATTYEASSCSEVDFVSRTPLWYWLSPCARAGGMSARSSPSTRSHRSSRPNAVARIDGVDDDTGLLHRFTPCADIQDFFNIGCAAFPSSGHRAR